MLSHLLIYIYHICKLNDVKPVMQVLKIKIGAMHNIEGIIAFRQNIYVYQTKKWTKIKPHLNMI